jgi:transposase
MRTPSKFVKELTDQQHTRLQEIYKTDAQWRTRQRAQAILLSARSYSVNQLADLFEIDRDRISQWLDWWDEYEFDGLADDPRSGRPALLRDEAKKKKH